MLYRVLKPVPTDHDAIPTGTIVDASGWRNVRTLVAGRYLEPVTDDETPAHKPAHKVADKPVKVAAKRVAAKPAVDPVAESDND